MTEIILNEYEWMESALSQPNENYKTPAAINRYARYLYTKGYKKADTHKAIEVFLLRCDPTINLVAWQDAIEYAVRNAGIRPLNKIDGIWITKSEFDRIMELKGWMARKVMFTILCVAKYMNTIHDTNNDWVNLNAKTIFTIANVKLSSRRQALMLNDLWNLGYIGYSKAIDNTNINVKIINEESEREVLVSDFRNLGNRFMLLKGNGFMECSECGLVIKRKSQAQKYCNECAARIHLKSTLESYHNSAA